MARRRQGRSRQASGGAGREAIKQTRTIESRRGHMIVHRANRDRLALERSGDADTTHRRHVTMRL